MTTKARRVVELADALEGKDRRPTVKQAAQESQTESLNCKITSNRKTLDSEKGPGK